MEIIKREDLKKAMECYDETEFNNCLDYASHRDGSYSTSKLGIQKVGEIRLAEKITELENGDFENGCKW